MLVCRLDIGRILMTSLLGRMNKLDDKAPTRELSVRGRQTQGEKWGVLDDVPCRPDSRSNRAICAICNNTKPKRGDHDDEGEARARKCWRLTSNSCIRDLQGRRASKGVDAEAAIDG